MEDYFCNLGICHVDHPVSQSRPPQKHFGLKCLERREAVSSTRHFCQTTFVVCTYRCFSLGRSRENGPTIGSPKMFQTLRVLGLNKTSSPGWGASRRRTSLQGHFEARREQLLCSARGDGKDKKPHYETNHNIRISSGRHSKISRSYEINKYIICTLLAKVSVKQLNTEPYCL